jgi:hypothetical protein
MGMTLVSRRFLRDLVAWLESSEPSKEMKNPLPRDKRGTIPALHLRLAFFIIKWSAGPVVELFLQNKRNNSFSKIGEIP